MSPKECVVVVFALSGTVVDTASLKRDGWRKVFGDRPAADDAVLQRIVDDVPGDRYVILKAAAKEIGIPDGEVEAFVASHAERYDAATRDINVSHVFTDVPETLERLSAKMPLYMSSLTPDDRLNTILDDCGLKTYFRGVQGSSVLDKPEQLRNISAQSSVPLNQILVVSNHQVDADAAVAVGCPFIGIPNALNGWVDGAVPFPVIAGVRDLPALLGL